MKKTNQATLLDVQNLATLSDLAIFLGFPPKNMSYLLYKLRGGPNGQYKIFTIKKRSGGTREIAAPETGLKGIQRQLANKLQDIYIPKSAAHGFTREKTILTNAREHSRKRYVFKVDLQDFFPSIHFGRVMGLFISKPYAIQRNIAIVIAKIACFNNVLPQGSPCSPVISNMICAYMDFQLSNMAKSHGCFYTRYADDITISTNKKEFPEEIAVRHNELWVPGVSLTKIIEGNSFFINADKTSMRTRSDRQLVTGIVVNDYPNIRIRLLKQLRAMLHDWRVNGLVDAQNKYKLKYDIANREHPSDAKIDFISVVRGKLEHLRYVRNYRIELLNKLDKEECIRTRKMYKKNECQTIHKDQFYKYFIEFEHLVIRDCGRPTILGEGKTDWMHFRRAFSELKNQGKYQNLELNIFKHKEYAKGGHSSLMEFCRNSTKLKVKFNFPVICIFDCDIQSINEKHTNASNNYVYHGNNVYSIILPQSHFRDIKEFSIEQYYSDADLLKQNHHNRRIYLSTEFEENTGRYRQDNNIFYGKNARNGEEIQGWSETLKNYKIIDYGVCIDENGRLKNIALSKQDFANSILKKIKPFHDIDFSSFVKLFDLIEKICLGVR